MTKSDLEKRLARQFPGIRKEDAQVTIDLFLTAMKEGLLSITKLNETGCIGTRFSWLASCQPKITKFKNEFPIQSQIIHYIFRSHSVSHNALKTLNMKDFSLI